MFRLVFLMLAFGVALLIFGTFATFVEIAPYAEGRNTDKRRFDVAAISVPAFGWSNDANILNQNDCVQNLVGIHGRAQPTQRRRAMAESCLSSVDAIISNSPANGYAWAVKAIAHSELGDVPKFNAALVRSQILSPNEQWLAEIRVQLFEEKFEDLSGEALAAETSDLTILVHSERGIKSIARRYIAEPDFRERITLIVEQLANADQIKFLGTVRTQIRQQNEQGSPIAL